MNLLFTSLVRKCFHSLNISSLLLSCYIRSYFYYPETRADLCVCPEPRQVWFTVCVVRDELWAGFVFRATGRTKRRGTKRRGEEDSLVVFYLVLQWMQADIIGKDCFINSQGPRPGSVCGCLWRSPWKSAALALFLCLWLSVYVWSVLLLSCLSEASICINTGGKPWEMHWIDVYISLTWR